MQNLGEMVRLEQPDAIIVTSGGFTTSANDVSLKNYNRCRIVLEITSTALVNGAVTLKQGATTGHAATNLPYARYFRIDDITSSNTVTETSSSSCTLGTASGTQVYWWEVAADDLNSANVWLRCNVTKLANTTAATLRYELYEPRYQANEVRMLDDNA